MKIRTIFNILGPLTNPAGADRQLMGVFTADLTELLAKVLGRLGTKQALIVNGYGGMDELTVTGPNQVSHLKEDGSIDTYKLDPADYGFKGASINDLQGGDPEESAEILRGVLDGSITGAKRDIVLLNGGAALWAAGKVDTLADGIDLARETIDSGAAVAKLDALIDKSQSYAS
jgi:anthranilate phosphoribosyltransferase